MTGYTYNSTDNVFSDGTSTEMATVSGSVSGGYTLDHTIYVAGGTMSNENFNQNRFGLGQNYPNPMEETTVIPLTLKTDAKVNIQIFDLRGRFIRTVTDSELAAGLNEITIDRNGLTSGSYIYKVKVTNAEGVFEQSKQLLVK